MDNSSAFRCSITVDEKKQRRSRPHLLRRGSARRWRRPPSEERSCSARARASDQGTAAMRGRPKGRNDVRRELSQLPTNFAGASRHRPKPRSTLQIAMSYCRLLWTDCILMYLYIYVYISISICIYLYRDSLSIYLPSYLSTFLWIGCLDCHFPSVGT